MELKRELNFIITITMTGEEGQNLLEGLGFLTKNQSSHWEGPRRNSVVWDFIDRLRKSYNPWGY